MGEVGKDELGVELVEPVETLWVRIQPFRPYVSFAERDIAFRRDGRWIHTSGRCKEETFDGGIDRSGKEMEDHEMIILVDGKIVGIMNCTHTTHVGRKVKNGLAVTDDFGAHLWVSQISNEIVGADVRMVVQWAMNIHDADDVAFLEKTASDGRAL